MTAKKMQKILWHSRWLLLVGIMFYNVYCFIVSFELSSFLVVHGFMAALYSFLGLWENYFTCKANCRL